MKRTFFLVLIAFVYLGCEMPVFDNPADEQSSAYVGVNGILASVESFSIVINSNNLTLSWNSPRTLYSGTPLKSTLVRRSDRYPDGLNDGDIMYADINSVSDSISYIDYDLELGKTYYYSVFASNDDGLISEPSCQSGILAYFTLTYSDEGADGGSVPEPQLDFPDYAVQIQDNSGGLYKADYQFSAWKRVYVDNSLLYYSPGDYFSLNENIILYPSWKTYISQYIAGGNNTFFLMSDGDLWGIGQNSYYQLKPVNEDSYPDPVLVSQNVNAVSAGGAHTLVLKRNGDVYGFGKNFDSSMGSSYQESNPESSPIIDDITMISAGYYHSLFLKNDGSVWGCGSNDRGQLAQDDTIGRLNKSTKIFDDAVFIDAGFEHSILLDKDDNLWGCGRNSFQQVVPGSKTDQYGWVLMQEDVKAASAGNVNTLVLDNDNKLWSYGVVNYRSITWMASGVSTPVLIAENVKEFEAGYFHNAYINNKSELWVYGYNNYGQLGTGDRTAIVDPVKIMDNVADFGLGFSHTLIIDSEGIPWSCGHNVYGQLGYGYIYDGVSGNPIKLTLDFESKLKQF